MTQHNSIPYTISNETITVLLAGKTETVRSDQKNFLPLRDALLSRDWQTASKLASPGRVIERWARGLFTFDRGVLRYNGQPLPEELNHRIIEMANAGDDPQSLMNFYERLQRNPSFRSVQQLWGFLRHCGIPITAKGTFLAYKGVRDDLKDVHSGTLDNTPGQRLKMPRNQISDDPNHACHVGLHVGALSYAQDFGPQVVICEVDPEHVVCVPNDHSQQKMRVCEYYVVGFHGEGTLPDTSIDDEDVPTVEPRTFFLNEQQEPPAATVEHTAKTEPTAETSSGNDVGRTADSFSKDELEEMSMQALRYYATKHLKIVGASKIPGGKDALICAITKVQKKARL